MTTFTARLESTQDQPSHQRTKLKSAKFISIALNAGVALIAAAGTAYVAADFTGTKGDTVRETVDRATFQVTGSAIFADQAVMREHMLNITMRDSSISARNDPIGESAEEAEMRVRRVAQEKLAGTFHDPKKFNKLFFALEKNIAQEKLEKSTQPSRPDIRSKEITLKSVKQMRVDYASDAYTGKLTYK